MGILEKVIKIGQLKTEGRKLQKEIGDELFNFVMEEFKILGFIEDPRQIQKRRGLYNPELGISIWVGNITSKNVKIGLNKMTNNGLDYDREVISRMGQFYFVNGNEINWSYTKDTFDTFISDVFTKRVEVIKSFC